MAIAVRIVFIHISLSVTCGLALVCPKCHNVQNINMCGEQTEQCQGADDVCMGTLKRWHISMGCSTAAKCHHDSQHNTTDCSGSHPFKPRDRCTICCSGHDCNTPLRHIQEGLDKIADLLHCPVCHDERDPFKCLDNFVTCTRHEHTCQVQKHDGLITSGCSKDASTCLGRHDNANRLNKPYCIGTTEQCTVCCNDHDCLDYAFGVQTTPTLPPGSAGIGGTSPTLTFSPPTACRDQTLFPCHLAVGEACSDSDVSAEFCRLTCGLCQAPGTIPTTATPTHHGMITHAPTTPAPSNHQVTGAGCPDMWTQFDGSCYLLGNDKLTFLHANDFCESGGASLVEIETAKENNFIKNFMKDKIVQHGVWLGANDVLFEGHFVWDNSEQPLNFTDWYPGEPNQATEEEDCMSSWKKEGYQWADHYCERPDLVALCERPVTKCS